MESKTTTTLSISSPYITSNCSDVISILRAAGIPASVTSNRTITSDRREENGCRIVFGHPISPSQVTDQIWPQLQDNIVNLKCAHLKVDSHYDGCIYDYRHWSKCPSFSDKNEKNKQ